MRLMTACYERLLVGLSLLPGALVALIAVGTCADVVSRDLGYSGMYGMLEVSEYSLLILTMAGAGFVMRIGRHVTVDILPDTLPPRAAWWVSVAAGLLATIFCALFLWFSVATVIESYRSGELIQKTFVIPEWWPTLMLPFGFFFLTIETFRRLIVLLLSHDFVRGAGQGRDGGV
jgi:TRAP-type C4-dicarboxylate transport system permease small subunit